MVTAIKTLSDTEKDILASLVGSRLVRVEAALAAPPDGAWNTVRLRTDRGSVDVSCLLETLPLNDVGDYSQPEDRRTLLPSLHNEDSGIPC